MRIRKFLRIRFVFHKRVTIGGHDMRRRRNAWPEDDGSLVPQVVNQ